MSGRVRARGGKGRTGTEREHRKIVLVALMTELFDQSFIVIVTCLMMFFESSKTKIQLYDMFHFPILLFIYLPCFCFFFPSLMMCCTFPCQISFLSLSFSIYSFSNQLQQLIFFIGHLDCSSLSSFTNHGPFVWKHENPNMQHTPAFSGSLEKLF